MTILVPHRIGRTRGCIWCTGIGNFFWWWQCHHGWGIQQQLLRPRMDRLHGFLIRPMSYWHQMHLPQNVVLSRDVINHSSVLMPTCSLPYGIAGGRDHGGCRRRHIRINHPRFDKGIVVGSTMFHQHLGRTRRQPSTWEDSTSWNKVGRPHCSLMHF